MSTVFHYAPWSRLRQIVDSGVLLPSAAGGRPGEPGLVWFSAHQQWEPTATKVVRNGGAFRTLTFQEHAQTFGCIRFGLAASDPRLLDWSAACKFAGIGRADRRALEVAGHRKGANPSHWFASPIAVPLRDLELHVWVGAWRLANDPSGMAEAWAARNQS